jgi:hypothetical protein
MPVLLRIIAQRLLLLTLSGLAFVGINPEIRIPTHEEAQIATEKRKDAIQEALQEKPDINTQSTNIRDTIPLPKTNVLDVPFRIPQTPNITRPGANRSTPPVIDPAPNQTAVQPIPEKIIPAPAAQKPAPPAQQPSPEPIPTKPTQAKPAVVSATSAINDVVVNILCMRYNGNRIHVSSGSGVFISAKGVILTNSHVAQMFLLKDIGYECSIRRENIPGYGFTAIPLYISEQWVTNNYRAISNPSPTGTGEDDYALLLVTGTTDPSIALPKTFAYAKLNVNADAAAINDSITVAGYPGIQTADINLAVQAPLKTDTVSIKNVFTLDRITVDVFGTTDTNVAKRGSSGGGVFEDGKLIGIIVTTTQGTSPSAQSINALTLDYINRDLKETTGKSLTEYSSENLLETARSFGSSVGQRLAELLLQTL